MLHILEQGASRNGSVHVVKEFVRAGAGHVLPDPQDLRPPDVLLDALHYLIAWYVNLALNDGVLGYNVISSSLLQSECAVTRSVACSV